jgi:hypothetical protein
MPCRDAGPIRATTPARGRSVRRTEPSRFPARERTMGDKSPHQSKTKKSGKSIKEKRIDRKAKADHTSQMEKLTHPKQG